MYIFFISQKYFCPIWRSIRGEDKGKKLLKIKNSKGCHRLDISRLDYRIRSADTNYMKNYLQRSYAVRQSSIVSIALHCLPRSINPHDVIR